MQRSTGDPKPAIGFLLLTGFVVGVFALINFGAGGTFQSIEVFALIALFSLFAAYIAMKAGYVKFQWFDGKFGKDDLKWMAIGLAGVFASVVGITSVIPGAVGILSALFVGGIVLAIVLIKSKNFLSPVIVHGLYNTIVLLASQGALQSIGVPASAVPLSASPIFVPVFQFDGLTPDNLAGQAAMQVFVVSFSEELLKIAIAIAVSFVTRSLYLAWGVSVASWTLMHALLSYRI